MLPNHNINGENIAKDGAVMDGISKFVTVTIISVFVRKKFEWRFNDGAVIFIREIQKLIFKF